MGLGLLWNSVICHLIFMPFFPIGNSRNTVRSVFLVCVLAKFSIKEIYYVLHFFYFAWHYTFSYSIIIVFFSVRTRSFVFTSCIPTHVHHAFLKWVDFIKTFVRALKFSVFADRSSIHTSLHVVYTSFQETVILADLGKGRSSCHFYQSLCV